MNRTPDYPCHLFHKTKKECQLIKSEADHKKLHGHKDWVIEEETSYYEKPKHLISIEDHVSDDAEIEEREKLSDQEDKKIGEKPKVKMPKKV